MKVGIKGTGYAVMTIAALAWIAQSLAFAQTSGPSKAQLRRGEYLVDYGGCSDCHTPKTMTPQGPAPDKARLLSGHPADAQLPPNPPSGVIGPTGWGGVTNNDLTAWVGPWGTSFAANLTPDPETGLGKWTADDFIKTIRTGKHLGVGRPVLPPMPWYDVAVLTDPDLKAVFAYLQSIKPIRNAVPQPVPPK
jgi:mono/diheme cytochrome c family protein